MAGPPWVKVLVSLVDSDKLGQLSSDVARWGWVKALLRAKTQRRLGVFASHRHLREVLGQHGRYVPEYLSVGLVHVMPTDCPRCALAYGDASPGEVVMHDYRQEQRDPTNAERQQRHRAAQAARSAPRNGRHNGAGNADRNAVLTGAGGDGDGDGDGDMGTPGIHAPSPVAGAAWGGEWHPFLAAWAKRRFRRPPTDGQRRALWGEGEDHGAVRDYPLLASSWVDDAPPGANAAIVVRYVLDRYHERRAMDAPRG